MFVVLPHLMCINVFVQWLEAQSGTSGQLDTGTSSSQLNEEHFKKKAVWVNIAVLLTNEKKTEREYIIY